MVPDSTPDNGPDDELLQAAAGTFAMLATATRIHLLWLLARGRYDVTTLARAVGATTAATSQHLGKLRLAGLVSARRDGKRQLYTVDDPHVVALIDLALDHHADLRRARSGLRRDEGVSGRDDRTVPPAPSLWGSGAPVDRDAGATDRR